MIIVAILTLLGAVTTIFICKSINASFDLKSEQIVQKEKELVAQQDELRRQRRKLKRELEDLKQDFKTNTAQKEITAAQKVRTGKLRNWLIDKEVVDQTQYQKAEKYATEKNMDILSALLTLHMITIESYERIRKKKLQE